MINLSLQYLTHALTLSATWKQMKPHTNDLLTRCVLPLMCFSDEDEELWREDPQEYIRKVYCSLSICNSHLKSCSSKPSLDRGRQQRNLLVGGHMHCLKFHREQSWADLANCTLWENNVMPVNKQHQFQALSKQNYTKRYY